MSNKLSDAAMEEIKILVEKAAPHKIELTETLGKKMTFLRQSFVLHFVQNINKKKDKEEYLETKIAQEKIFRKIKDYVYYEGQDSSNARLDGLNKLDKLLEEVSTALQYLRYIGHTENLDNCLAKYGLTIKTRDIESIHSELADETTKDNITKLFEASRKAQAGIYSEAEAIGNIFGELSEEIKYDSKTNKSGLRCGQFNKLVALEAIKRKSEELAEKRLDALKDSVGNTIDSQLNVQAAAQNIAE